VNKPHIEPPRERKQSLLSANSIGGDASLSTNLILHGRQEVDNQTQDHNDELQDTGTSPTASGDMMASKERPLHDNDVPPTNRVSPSRNELLVQGTDGGGPPHCVLLPSGIDGVDTEGNAPVPTLEIINMLNAVPIGIQEVATNPMPPFQPRQLFKSPASVPRRPVCIQPPMHPTLIAPDPPHVFEPPILRKVKMISSLLACSLSKGIMPRWHKKWPCHKAMSLLKRPILLLLNKVAPPVICNQCMKPSLQGIHPRFHCKWFLPPFHPMPPRDRSLRMLLKAAWVMLPPSLPT
jgi:hypothetical protein